MANERRSKWSVAQLVTKNSHTLPHTLNSQLQHKGVHNTNIKTLEEMFLQAPHKLQEEAIQSLLDVSDHPETTSKPKHGYSPGRVVYVLSVLSRLLLNPGYTHTTSYSSCI